MGAALDIVFAVHHFPPTYSGGAEQRALRTARALVQRGHRVRVLAIETIGDGPPAGLAWQDDVYAQIPVRRLRMNLAFAPNPFQFEYDNLWIGDHLHDWLAEDRPDLFHLFSGYLVTGRSLCVAHALGIPSALSLTDFWFLCRRIQMVRSNGELSTLPIDPARCARCIAEEQRRYRWPGMIAPGVMDRFWEARAQDIARFEQRMAFNRSALGRANVVISPSQFVLNTHVAAGMPSDRMRQMRQGRAPAQLPATHTANREQGILHLAYIGQIAPHKGVHLLVDALSRLATHNIELRIYGDLARNRTYVEQLRRTAQGDPRIHFAGEFGADQLPDVMAEIDALVVPSMWYENSPNVILEAFAYGRPVIASNLGGMAELVQHEVSGLLFQMGDAQDLARQIERLVAKPNLLVQIEAGVPAVRTVDDEIDELVGVYNAIVCEGPLQPANASPAWRLTEGLVLP